MKEKKYYTVGEAADIAETTSETLRHYDRIGLVRPGKKDEWTGYRLYSDQDIVRLNTVRALQMMDLSLKEIRQVLELDDLEKIISFLTEAEKKADRKIAALRRGKEKIRLAKSDYQRKLKWQEEDRGINTKYFPQRVIMLSPALSQATLDNLWNYLAHFYEALPDDRKDQFEFEDLAGIYSDSHCTRLFALCLRHGEAEGLKVLPEGRYLCAKCSEAEREATLEKLKRMAGEKFGADADFSLQIIIVSGILHWDFEVQIYIGKQNAS